MFNIIGRRRIWFGISSLFIVASIASIFVFGVKLGIDFTGGSLLEVKVEQGIPTKDKVEQVYNTQGIESVSVQPSGEHEVIIRSAQVTEKQRQDILTELKKDYGKTEVLRFDSIGPTLGKELQRKSIMAIILVLLAIIIYISYAFRKISRPVASWKYGLFAIIALFHDIIIVGGLYLIMGHFANYEVDTLLVTALLTVLAYSVNDTIVTFDRIRENLLQRRDESFPDLVNRSIYETITRSLSTSTTIFLVLVCIFLFGGETIRPFIYTLMVGIVIGTYSSICIASPLLVAWQTWSEKRRS